MSRVSRFFRQKTVRAFLQFSSKFFVVLGQSWICLECLNFLEQTKNVRVDRDINFFCDSANILHFPVYIVVEQLNPRVSENLSLLFVSKFYKIWCKNKDQSQIMYQNKVLPAKVSKTCLLFHCLNVNFTVKTKLLVYRRKALNVSTASLSISNRFWENIFL